MASMKALDPFAAVTAGDPYPYYAHLVSERPFYRDESCGIWVASSADAVEAVLSNDVMRVRPSSEAIPQAIARTPSGDIFGRLVRMTDGAAHVARKEAVRETFESLDMSQVATATERTATQLLEKACQDHPFDLDDYAFGLPTLVVAGLLGFSEHDASRTVARTRLLVRSFASETAADVTAGAAAAVELCTTLSSLCDVPGAPFLATLVATGRLTGLDGATVVANAVGFLSQSYEASAGLIGNVLLALAAAPREVRESAARDPGVLGAVVAETARHDAPIQNTRRFCASEVTLFGSRVREGDTLLAILAAANRDPRGQSRPAPLRCGPRRAPHLHVRARRTRVSRGRACDDDCPSRRRASASQRHRNSSGARERIPSVAQCANPTSRRRKASSHRMIAVIFEVWPHRDRRQEYLDIAAELRPLLDTIDGFVSIERFQSLSSPGKILSLSIWRDEGAIAQWRALDPHRSAQTRGRTVVFEDYRLRIAGVIRDYGLHERREAPADSRLWHDAQVDR